MQRIKTINHQAQNILYIDFSGCNNPDELVESVKIVKAVVSKNPANSILCLTDMTDSLLTHELIVSLKDLAKFNAPYVKASAILGISREKQCLLDSVIQFSGRKIVTFEEIQSAKDWLVSQK
jgi:hypothetical protein